MDSFHSASGALIGLSLLVYGAMPWPVWADVQPPRSQTVVVTATRLESAESATPGAVTVIGAPEIERKQAASVADLLRDVPGLSLSNQGGAGRATSVFVRGTNPEHVLVLIDGVKANDPLHPGRAFDFGALSAQEVERIEIVRGPGSVLYGSDAMGGVIQVFTKKGRGRARAEIESEYGAFESLSTRASIRGGTARSDYALSGEFENARGFSAANETMGNTEKDGRTLWRATGRAGGEALPGVRADLSARVSQSRFDLDLNGGPAGDDPNYTGEARELESRLQFKPTRVRAWEPVGAISYSVHQRRTDNDPDALHPDFLHGRYESARIAGDFQNNFYLSDNNTWVVGTAFEAESGNSSEESLWGTSALSNRAANAAGFFVQDQRSWAAFHLTSGARLDWRDRYGWVGTYRAAPSYDLAQFAGKAFTLKASVGTGFKAPSLYQLYAPIYGNEGLLPEQNLGYELGLSWSGLSVTYFGNHLENLITGAAPTFVYQNIGRARTEGVELAATVDLSDRVTLSSAYTWTRSVDESKGLALLRRPMHEASAEAAIRPDSSLQVSVGGRYVGSRWDLDAVSFARKEMAPYFVARAAARWNVGKSYRVMARIENALDEHYEEIDGYGTAGRSVYVGVGAEL